MAGAEYCTDRLDEWEQEPARATEEQYPEEFKTMVIQVAMELQGKVKKKTSKKTSRLQNNWKVGGVRRRGDEYVIEVYNNVEYAEAVEWEYRRKVGQYVPALGKRLKTKTVKGAHTMELPLAELQAVFPGYLQEWMNDFLNTHDIVQDRRNCMNENVLQVVKDAAISMLRGHEPGVDVHAGEIMRTDRMLESENKDSSKWYFVEVAPTSFMTISPNQTEAALMVSVDYHESEESVRRYGKKAMELDRVFQPVFPFAYGGERRVAMIARVTTNISGGMLHLTFPLTFIVSGRAEEGTEVGVLEMRSERG